MWPVAQAPSRIQAANAYFSRMLLFEFCLPGITVPDGPDWLHEVKYDGYRLRLERDGDRARLITRGGYKLDQPLPLDSRGRPQGSPEALRARWRGGRTGRRWHLRF